MSIQFADQKIREVRQRVTALDRELNELRGSGERTEGLSVASLDELREQHYQLRQERKKAYRELLELLELDETPRDEMGNA